MMVSIVGIFNLPFSYFIQYDLRAGKVLRVMDLLYKKFHDL